MGFKEALNAVTVGIGFVTGYLILGVLLRGSHWQVAQGQVWAQLGVLPKPRHFTGVLHVGLGLHQVDVSLNGRLQDALGGKLQNGTSSLITFHESFDWSEDGGMEQHLRRGLRSGLPFPVLTLIEHLAMQERFWGPKFGFVGRLVNILLCLSLGCGLVSVLLGYLGEQRPLCVTLGITGCLLLTSVVTYDLATFPEVQVIHFARGQLSFYRGWCYVLLLYLGVSSIAVSILSYFSFYWERMYNKLGVMLDFLQKVDHLFQKHGPTIKPTA